MSDLSQLFGMGSGISGTAGPYGSSGPGGPQPDFNGLYDALQKAQSPYTTMPAQGWLQNNHPGIAHVLDNAFLTLGSMPNTPNVSGAGENIAAVAQGLLGAQHARRQHAVEQAMLPIQVAQQGLGYQKNLMEILKDQAEVGMYGAHSKYYDQLGKYRDYLQNDKPLYAAGGPKVDDNGEPWMFNQRTGQNEYVGDNPDVANNPNYNPTFLKGGKGSGRAAGLSLFGLSQSATGADPSTADGANAILNRAAQYQTGLAGGKAGAGDVGHQPEEDSKNFLGIQKQYIADRIGKAPSEAEQKDLDAKQQLLSVLGKAQFDKFYGPGASNFQYKNLQDRQADYATKAQQARELLGRYVKSGAHRKGISIQDWAKSQQAPAQVAPAPPSATPDLGSALDSVFGAPPQRP